MKRSILCVMVWLAFAATSLAQGIQTGTIRGVVRDPQNLPAPGVTVTVTSPSLQGARAATTDAQGLYTVSGLPAGEYGVKFELAGFVTVTRATTVPLGLTVEEVVTLGVSAVSATVNVVSEFGTPISNPSVGANFKQQEIESLATPRTLEGIAQLAPAVNENGVNHGNSTSVGQVVINGAFGFDNAFLVNGVDVNDNLFATPQNLFVEDAIQETQILTSGVSAEFGRFSGGVINAITRSGGNVFSGSGRIDFTNPAWTTETPFEVSNDVTHLDEVSRVYEGTFGGPLVKDRLWFFLSGRYGEQSSQVTLPVTASALTSVDSNKRGEIKITGTPVPNHTFQGGYFNNSRNQTNWSGAQGLVIDPHSEDTLKYPNWYVFTNYRGVVKNKYLVEAQYSERRMEFLGGGTGTDLVKDSPFLALSCACLYNAPYFDAADAEQRNNRQATASISRSWNFRGQHTTKGGYEFYRSQRMGGGSQSPTSYVFNADFVTNDAGEIERDSTGRPIPIFDPDPNNPTFISYYPAVRGAVLNNDNNSLYVQDHWALGNRWSFDLGARYEHVRVASTGGIVSISNNRIVPRLAASYALDDKGDRVIHVTYGQYSGRYNEAQLGKNSPVGNAPEIDAVYTGPIGQGYDFSEGFNLKNYPIVPGNALVSDPTQNVFVAPGTKSPLTHEFTFSYGEIFMGGRGYSEVSFIARTTHDLIEDFQTLANGTTDVTVSGVSAGTFTNIVYQNTDLAHRMYQAMVFQSRYRIAKNWTVAGHYTLQLKNEGNYEGESTNLPGAPSTIGNFPEAFSAARNFPDGRLQSFQRSRLRLWSTYNWEAGRYGALSLSGLWRVDSGLVYSLVARNQTVTETQAAILDAAGYPDGSATRSPVFFGERGSETFKGYGLFDLSLNYSLPVARSLRPWIKLDIFNVFNNQKLIAWDTTVSQNAAGGVDSLGLATSYIRGPKFGTATGNTVTNLFTSGIPAYPVSYSGATAGGRTVALAVGFRF